MEKYIGIYGGSFNPPHLGHTGLALEVLRERPEITEIWFMVASQNPLKEAYQVSFQDRYEMTRLACSVDSRLIPCDLEASLGSSHYTVDVLRELSKTWPGLDFALIMGEDSYWSLPMWKDYQDILSRYPVYVYRRSGVGITGGISSTVTGGIFLESAKDFKVSSSGIRLGACREEDSVDPTVLEYIKGHGLYRLGIPDTLIVDV